MGTNSTLRPLEPLLPGETRSEYIARVDNAARARLAYQVFRCGLRHPNTIPRWDDAPSWIRDVAVVAYLQGKLDGKD